MISSPFPHHTIASLRQVGMMGLTPLRFELNRVKLFGTELDTHKQGQRPGCCVMAQQSL